MVEHDARGRGGRYQDERAGDGAGGQDLIEIGRLGRPHGVQGRMTLIAHDEETVLSEAEIDLYLESGRPLRTISRRITGQGRFILEIEGVGSREEAAALTGQTVLIRREDLPEPDEGFYLVDLLGMTVADEEGRCLGRVEGVLPTGGVDVLEIDGELGAWMMPAADEMIVDVDPETRRLVVRPPQGLVPGTESA